VSADVAPEVAARSLVFVGAQCFVALLLSITAYAFLAYPDVPQMFGGGDRQAVLLRCGSAELPACKALPLPKQNGGAVIGPVVVLVETSEVYVVTVPNAPRWGFTPATRVRRELFDAMTTSAPKRKDAGGSTR
jgi:hypothetical protein